ERYRWDSAEYAEAFATLLRCYGSRGHLYALLRDLLAHVPAGATAIDWGAGTGDLTRVLLEQARTVPAVEPNPVLRDTLAANCPAAHVIGGTIMSAAPPARSIWPSSATSCTTSRTTSGGPTSSVRPASWRRRACSWSSSRTPTPAA